MTHNITSLLNFDIPDIEQLQRSLSPSREKLLVLLDFDAQLTAEEKEKVRAAIESSPPFFSKEDIKQILFITLLLNQKLPEPVISPADTLPFEQQLYCYYRLYRSMKQQALTPATT